MTVERTVRCLVAACALSLVAAWIGKVPAASAAKLQCAQTVTLASPSSPAPSSETAATAPSPGSPSAGNPCWVDATPYPFGSDGNAVDPTSQACLGVSDSNVGPNGFGPNWGGDFLAQGGDVINNPPCYEQVTSMAFRAWNRGLAATDFPDGFTGESSNAFGVWLYNGTSWFPDPTFPGAGVCPGNTVLWAGKLDYWLIPSSGSTNGTTLCRFDGVNLFWQPLTLPAQTLAHLPTNAQGQTSGGITSGTCFSWDNCWFLGTDGIEVHWDGQQLTDETPGLGTSPWLQSDFTVVGSGVNTAGGATVALAVNSGQMTTQFTQSPAPGCTTSLCPTPTLPDGSPAPRSFGSSGGLWSPLTFAPPDETIVNELALDSAGDVAWATTQPSSGVPQTPGPVPLIRLGPDGTQPACSGYAADTFTFGGVGAALRGLQWASLGVAPDGSVFAGGLDTTAANWNSNPSAATDTEPVIVHGGCGDSPGQDSVAGDVGSITEFREPDPFDTDQSSAQMVPADSGGSATITAISAPATNDVWATTGFGSWVHSGFEAGLTLGGPQRPHLYQLTDGQAPNAPAGDDNEPRPSLFTLSPPVFQVESATVTVTPTVTTTTKKQTGKTKRKKLKPAIYGVRTRLQHGGTRKRPTYTLHLIFKLRRPTTVGVEALHGNRVVARAPMRRFKGRNGELSLSLRRKAWPTRLKLTSPPGQNGSGHSAPQPTSKK